MIVFSDRMAIRLQRVLIACGLPTILAIVSFYWLRKRRKAVIHNSSPEESSKETESIADFVTETDHSFMSCNSLAKQLKISSEKEVFISNSNRSESNCLHLDNYAMQLRDNNNCSPTTERTNACNAGSDQQFVSDNNSTNSMANQIESNNSNQSTGIKLRQTNCENNECNGNESQFDRNYSNISDDNIVFKLSNFSLNNEINDKDIQSKENEKNINSVKRDSNCDKCIEEVDSYGQNRSKSVSEPINTTVSSHKDNSDSNDCKSITKALINDNLSESNDNKSNDCQHIQVIDSPQLIEAHKQKSNEISVEVNNCGKTIDGLTMSQTNSIDNNTSSACSSSASCLMTNGYETGDMYHNYPDSVSNGVHSPPHSAFSDVHSEVCLSFLY